MLSPATAPLITRRGKVSLCKDNMQIMQGPQPYLWQCQSVLWLYTASFYTCLLTWLLVPFVQVCFCFTQSVASTRWMIQDEQRIQNTKCDNCLIGEH